MSGKMGKILGKCLMKVIEQCLFFACQIAVRVYEEGEMSDSWVKACSGFLRQKWIENLDQDPVVKYHFTLGFLVFDLVEVLPQTSSTELKFSVLCFLVEVSPVLVKIGFAVLASI